MKSAGRLERSGAHEMDRIGVDSWTFEEKLAFPERLRLSEAKGLGRN